MVTTMRFLTCQHAAVLFAIFTTGTSGLVILDNGARAATPISRAASPSHQQSGSKLGAQLISAAMRGDIATVRRCLALHADINARNYEGISPLEYSLIYKHVDVALVLIKKGANLSSRDNWGSTPLMRASAACPAKLIRILVEKAGDVNAVDRWGQNALMHASIAGNTAAVRILLSSGSEVNRTDRMGRTALSSSEGRGYTSIAKILRTHGAK